MHILTVGLNYRSASVELREKFAFQQDELPKALQQLKNAKSVLECVIVSTCNRTEIYAVVDRLHVCGKYIRDFVADWFAIDAAEFADHLYMLEDRAAIEHLFRVSAGLDSMIVGETQILGQVRDAFLAAQRERTTGTLFNMLFKQAITAAKRVHSETLIGESAVSVSYAAVELGKRIFGTFARKNVLIVGAGKMGELTGTHLRAGGAERVVVANRTRERAEELAIRFGGSSCALDEVVDVMINEDIDVVISSTGSTDVVLAKEQIEKVMSRRKARPLFMIDIAVPRDLDPAIHEVENVFLYDIDDLQSIVENNLEMRRRESVKAEALIAAEMDAYQEWYRTLGVVPVIRSLQDKAADIHRETMDSMLKKLPDLTEREIKVIRKLSKSMLNQLLHDPILQLKDMAAERKGAESLQQVVRLFALEERVASIKAEQAEESKPVERADDAEQTAAAMNLRLGEALARP